MFIREMSDLHLEFKNAFNIPKMKEDKDTVLILSGDICVVERLKFAKDFFNKSCEQFKHVIYVFGNHEYYKGSIKTTLEKFKKEIQHDNLHVLQKEVLVLDDYAFLGCTLWSEYNKGDPLSLFDCNNMMNDFHVIRNGPDKEPYQRRFTSKEAYMIHKNHVEWLNKSLSEHSDKKCIVATHHAPTFLSIAKEYRNDRLNGGYVSDLSELILNHQPVCWFHGHMHNTFRYKISNTDVFANPRGYPQIGMDGKEYYENSEFDPFFRIEV